MYLGVPLQLLDVFIRQFQLVFHYDDLFLKLVLLELMGCELILVHFQLRTQLSIGSFYLVQLPLKLVHSAVQVVNCFAVCCNFLLVGRRLGLQRSIQPYGRGQLLRAISQSSLVLGSLTLRLFNRSLMNRPDFVHLVLHPGLKMILLRFGISGFGLGLSYCFPHLRNS